jgi:signal transduction histidine kinase
VIVTGIRRFLARVYITRYATGWMASGICVSVALLSWFGYRAIKDSQRSSSLLLERRTSDAVDLLLLALSRDMRGVQDSVLMSSVWNVDMLEPPYDITTTVASAFARYPYPESFYGWRGKFFSPSLVFFNRLDRGPAWSDHVAQSGRFPVVVQRDPPILEQVMIGIERNRVHGGDISVFELEIGSVPYQFVTRLLYEDPFRDRLAGGLGFVVNLDWARRTYFPELANQVGRIGGASEGLSFAIDDEPGVRMSDAAAEGGHGSVSRRTFPLLFFDPLLVAVDRPADLRVRNWTAQVAATEPDAALAVNRIGDVRALVTLASAAGVFALGLALTSRAIRASARLAEMRSEFMSTVTHELKTPLATIRAIGDSVASGRVTSDSTLKEYAQMVVQESKRLARLVDNILAYSRITDITEAYHFEPLDVNVLLDEVLESFAAQLATQAFDLHVEIPTDLPLVRADRMATQLLFDNLIDNAVRYSRSSRWLEIRCEHIDGFVAIKICDKGMGIPSDELDHVVTKFFRGRRAGSGGSGLGLAIAKRIVNDHGGALTIDSRESYGTTVILTLPVVNQIDENTHPRG